MKRPFRNGSSVEMTFADVPILLL